VIRRQEISRGYLTHYRPAVETEKNILEDLFSSVLSQIKKYHPSGNLKFNYLGIFQSSKRLILKDKILSISLKLNFTPNTLGFYGLRMFDQTVESKTEVLEDNIVQNNDLYRSLLRNHTLTELIFKPPSFITNVFKSTYMRLNDIFRNHLVPKNGR